MQSRFKIQIFEDLAMEKDFRISLLLDFYGELLSPKQRAAIEIYYNEDCSLGEIASELGVTRQAVRDIIKRTEGALIQMEQKLGLYSRFELMLSGLERIKSLSEDIIALSDNDEIKRMSSAIITEAENLLKGQE